MTGLLSINNFLYFLAFLLVIKPVYDAARKEPDWFKKNIYSLTISLAIFGLNLYKDMRDSDEKVKSLIREKERDSSNTANYVDSLKRYDTKIMKLLAEYHLRYDSATNQIIKRIDTASGKQEAFITYDIEHTRHRQSNDTLFLYPSLANYGNSPAKDLSYKLFFLYKKDGVFYEAKKVIGTMRNVQIASQRYQYMASNDFFFANFFFDELSNTQYMLIMGKYKNISNQEKTFSLSYGWSPIEKRWLIYPTTNELVKLHLEDFQTEK